MIPERFHEIRKRLIRTHTYLERPRKEPFRWARFKSRTSSQPCSPTISAIRDGDLSLTQIARLSDLSRVNARALAAAWDSIPESNRIDLVRRFDELSEERVELNFGRALRALDDGQPWYASLQSQAYGKTNRANYSTGCETCW